MEKQESRVTNAGPGKWSYPSRVMNVELHIKNLKSGLTYEKKAEKRSYLWENEKKKNGVIIYLETGKWSCLQRIRKMLILIKEISKRSYLF